MTEDIIKMMAKVMGDGDRIWLEFMELLTAELKLSVLGMSMEPDMKFPFRDRVDRYEGIKNLIEINQKATNYFMDLMTNGDIGLAKKRIEEIRAEVAKLSDHAKKQHIESVLGKINNN
jgi:hypothetical protein